MSLLVKEIYPAIIGEGMDSGWPGILIRLSGCNLRCGYCDTQYAWEDGKKMSVKELAGIVSRSGFKRVLLTGGEPLAQKESIALMAALVKARRRVLLETNGTISLKGVPKAVHVIMDLKTPGSGEAGKNLYENLRLLKPDDEL